MSTLETKPNVHELSQCWRRFAEIVRMFAEKQIEREDIGADDYQTFHGKLLQSIQQASESVPEKCELHVGMKELAEPWVNLGSLQHADKSLLIDLSGRCDGVYRQLTNRSPVQTSKNAWLILLLCLFLGAFIIVVGTDVLGGFLDRFVDRTGTLAEWLEMFERNRNQSRTWVIVAVLTMGTLLTSWFVFRAPKDF